VALRNLEPGVIVHTHVLFADGTGGKDRPAVVLARLGRDVFVAPITGNEWARAGTTTIESWLEAGLKKPSFIEQRVLCVDRKIGIVGVIGQLMAEDQKKIIGNPMLIDSMGLQVEAGR